MADTQNHPQVPTDTTAASEQQTESNYQFRIQYAIKLLIDVMLEEIDKQDTTTRSTLNSNRSKPDTQ